jgi:Cytochrome P460
MKSLWYSVAFVLTSALLSCASSAAEEPAPPQYNQKGQLLRPADYREWMFLSAGYGMNYSPGPDGHELFTNVFVQRWAYDAFAKSGKWPEQTMFVIDERDAGSRSSINQKGHYQTDLVGLAVEVKDAKHNADQWTYYTFPAEGQTADPMPRTTCWSCHDAHAAVEHTFVQFYPTLKAIANQYNTYNASREQVTDAK